MATISSIGTSSRTYSTVSAWLAAFATGGWEGELYNDTQFTAGGSFTGHAVGASDYIILRCASGQSFRDNANVQTNALAFGASNGVSFSATTTTLFTIGEDYVTISGIQAANTTVRVVDNNQATASGANVVLENCILENTSTTTEVSRWRTGLMRNCLLVARSSSARRGILGASGGTSKFINVTVVRPSNFTIGSDAWGVAGTVTIENCAGFGFTTFGSAAFSGSNNCSDTTIGSGTSNQASKTYANQFVTTTDSGRDFKVLNNSADLYDNAVTDTTNIPAANDIAGTSRPQGSAWDIGCWELVVGGATHPSTGALVGPGTVVAGTANRFRAHPSTGTITGPGAVIIGAATRFRAHPSTGAIVGPGAVIAGTAVHTAPGAHSATGALVGQGSTIAGSAAHIGAHPSTGTLVGPGSVISGAALRTPALVTHTATGALVGPGAVISGTATGPSTFDAGMPLTDAEQKRYRKRLKAQEDEIAAAQAEKRKDQDDITAGLKQALKGSETPGDVPGLAAPDDDDEDDDIVALLLYG